MFRGWHCPTDFWCLIKSQRGPEYTTALQGGSGDECQSMNNRITEFLKKQKHLVVWFVFNGRHPFWTKTRCRPLSVPFCWGGDDIGFLVLAKALIIGREPGLWFLGLQTGDRIQLHRLNKRQWHSPVLYENTSCL